MKKALEQINSPADLKRIPVAQLPGLAEEIREEIIRVIAKNGGHLGASLGTVELTIALHYIFEAPKDKIVWDVGHQAHGHKILTGRRDRFKPRCGTRRRFTRRLHSAGSLRAGARPRARDGKRDDP